MVKFIHSADLHMDRSFEGLTVTNTLLNNEFAKANEMILEKIVDYAIINEVDFVLLAGDTFHQTRPSLRTQSKFFEQINRLKTEKIPVYMIFGNHDYYAENRYWFNFPANVEIFTKESVETKYFTTSFGEKIALSGFSYTQPWITKQKVLEFPKREQVDFHIGIYHGEIGQENRGKYAPFSISQMADKGYDYWALGHIHVPMVLSDSPRIIYPGAPQGHTQKETEAGSAILIELLNDGVCTSQALEIAEIIWKNEVFSLQHETSTSVALQKLLDFKHDLSISVQRKSLVHISISHYDQLDNDFLRRVKSGEILDYMNQEGENHKVYVWRISLKEADELDTIHLPVSQALVDQIFSVYGNQETFEQILADLYTQNDAYRLILDYDLFRENTLQTAQELLNNDFTFGRDEV